jgi:hypothetical protein
MRALNTQGAFLRYFPFFSILTASLRTGYMHNRCRMVVASYLSKDLLLDWRKGEKYFMQQLSAFSPFYSLGFPSDSSPFSVDGDLAQNNGGWQWSASTGCDPQPFFVRFPFFLFLSKLTFSVSAHLQPSLSVREDRP